MLARAKSLGELLRKWRQDQRLSQEELAAQAGVARSTLIRWERETHQPRLPELMAALDALGVSPALREQAVFLISAPRAAHYLRTDNETSIVPGEEWIAFPHPGDLLRTMRLRQQQTQEQVAGQMGVRRHTLSRWEGGELIPSPERLHQLLTVLGAHPDERAALIQTGYTTHLPIGSANASLDEIENRLQHIAYGAFDANLEALKDLEYFRLETGLAQKASRGPAARHLLLSTYTWHAQWLMSSSRYREAIHYTDRVLDAIRKERFPELDWPRVGLVAARCAVYSGERPRPGHGVEILNQWLPFITRPEYEAWAYGDMALYMKQAGRIEQALDLSARACRVALHCDNPTELRCRRVDRAEILLETGQPHNAMYALELLPIDKADHPNQQAREAVLWASGMLAVGETTMAQVWLARASALTESYNLTSVPINELATRLKRNTNVAE